MVTVPDLLQAAPKLWTGSEVRISFARATDIDSAAVALMLQWRREAQARGMSLVFEDIPHNLKTLLALYGLSFLAGVGDPA